MKKIQLIIALCTMVFFSAFAQNKGSEIPAVELLDSALINDKNFRESLFHFAPTRVLLTLNNKLSELAIWRDANRVI